MTEWTSVSLKKGQKAKLKDHKPDDMSMGDFLVSLVGESDPSKDTLTPEEFETMIRESIDGVEVDADELAETLSKKLGSDLEMAAYRGCQDALEGVR